MFGDVLIVDDESDICDLVAGVLEDEGYEARIAQDSDSALREITRRCPAMVLLDVWLQGSRLDGLEILNILRERYPNLPVVIISGHGNIDTAVTAIRSGAYDYIEKPFKSDKLLVTVARAIEAARLQRENAELKRRADVQLTLVGKAAATGHGRAPGVFDLQRRHFVVKAPCTLSRPRGVKPILAARRAYPPKPRR